MDASKKQNIINCVVAATFAIVTGLAGLCNKVCAVYAIPFVVLLIRYTLSFVCNLGLQKAGVISVKLKGKGHKKLLFANAFIYSGSHLAQICGLMFAPSFMNGIMFATVPIYVEILSRIVLKEKSSLRQYFFIALSMTCVITMVLIGAGDVAGTVNLPGTLLLFTSCMLEAVNNITIRFLRKEYSPMEIGFSAAGISTVFLVIVIAVQCTVFGVPDVMTPFKNPSFLLSAAYLGICCTMVAGLTKGYVLQHMAATKASAWNNLNTVISLLAGAVILHEPLRGYHIICTIGIIIGVAGVQLSKSGVQASRPL